MHHLYSSKVQCSLTTAPSRLSLADRYAKAHAGSGLTIQPRVDTAATTSDIKSNTRLFAKATYASFEDLLAKEPGALLVDFYAT